MHSNAHPNDPLYGLIPGVFTPLDEEYNIQEDRLRSHLDWLSKHVHSFTITAVNGEFYALTFDEWKTCADIAIEKRNEHNIPVWTNFGSESYEKTIRYVDYAESVGFDGIRIVIPYYVHPDQEGYEEYYRDVAAATDLPILLYPSALAGRKLKPATVGRLASIENIIGIKVSSINFQDLINLSMLTDNYQFKLAPADELLFYHMYRAGLCSDVCIGPGPQLYPQVTQELWNVVTDGDWPRAEELTEFILDVKEPILAEYPINNPAHYKYALKLVGRPLGPCRRPVSEPSKAEKDRIKSKFEEHGLV